MVADWQFGKNNFPYSRPLRQGNTVFSQKIALDPFFLRKGIKDNNKIWFELPQYPAQ
jgi:hypothetical protein